MWQSIGYLRRGLAISGRAARLHLLVLLVYAAPAVAAGFLSAGVVEPSFWEWSAMAVLPWITVVLGTTVLMVVVGRQVQGHSPSLGRATWEGLRWTPRYLWTNVHTSLMFWPPVVLLVEAHEWQQAALPLGGAGALVADLAWWLVIGLVAMYLHVRTLLAPFLAVHADLPGTVAALEGWRLSGRHFGLCLATFIAAIIPVGLPLLLSGVWLLSALQGEAQQALQAAVPDLFAAGIQAVRPVLIPALYLLYGDLWRAELARREQDGGPVPPPVAAVLLALTKPLPKYGRW